MNPVAATTSAPTMPATTFRPAPYTGPTREEVLAMRREFLTPALVTYYKDPLMIVQGHMQWLFDERGRRYLDLFAGIVTVSVGHCHPKVLEAVREQNERLQHTTTIYLHPKIAQFGKKLIGTFPKGSGLDTGVCYFTNSGGEANDLAVMMARCRTGVFDVIALRNAYHGMSSFTMGLSALHTWKQPIPHGFGVHHARLPDRYRGPWGYGDADAGVKYAEDVLDLIRSATSGQIAAFIAEPILGVGGAIELPPGYLKAVYQHVRAAGGLCISDEVQTGFGRTGDAFWGFESVGGPGVVPDIVTMAKGIGNGAPLGCCVARAEVAQAMTKRLHFNTYGGNPVSMAQGLATLEVILEEGIQRRAKEIGAYLMEGLRDLQKRHAIVGDVRGRGLMLGVEIVEDQKSKAASGAKCAAVFERCREMGVLVGKGGLNGNVLRIKPPMCITREDCDFACRVLDIALSEQR
ncbi:MAG: aspartate aminotransferase family protein [Phycisphaerales bacterium]|nr:aspartate aminotransferase family protein [Phycisphaerales bacterium]